MTHCFFFCISEPDFGYIAEFGFFVVIFFICMVSASYIFFFDVYLRGIKKAFSFFVLGGLMCESG